MASSLNPCQIVEYDKVKSLQNHPETLLIDVREADEIAATGKIPTSINVPCKYLKIGNLHDKYQTVHEDFR
jgi:rhodanese-related sulfurtransferase